MSIWLVETDHQDVVPFSQEAVRILVQVPKVGIPLLPLLLHLSTDSTHSGMPLESGQMGQTYENRLNIGQNGAMAQRIKGPAWAQHRCTVDAPIPQATPHASGAGVRQSEATGILNHARCAFYSSEVRIKSYIQYIASYS